MELSQSLRCVEAESLILSHHSRYEVTCECNEEDEAEPAEIAKYTLETAHNLRILVYWRFQSVPQHFSRQASIGHILILSSHTSILGDT